MVKGAAREMKQYNKKEADLVEASGCTVASSSYRGLMRKDILSND